MKTLLVMTDGRRACVERSIPTALEACDGNFDLQVIHDDSGDCGYRDWLHESFPAFKVIGAPERNGFAGAIRNAWSFLRSTDTEWVFHLEDDFLLTNQVPLLTIIKVLDERPHLAQMALLRQPCNAVEEAAGCLTNVYPEAYATVRDRASVWREHRLFFTTNPSVYGRSIFGREWPAGPNSEGRFGLGLFGEDPAFRSALWGLEQRCEHIGIRQGTGY